MVYSRLPKKLEDGPGTFYVGVPSFLGFWIRGESYSNFLAPTVIDDIMVPYSFTDSMVSYNYLECIFK